MAWPAGNFPMNKKGRGTMSHYRGLTKNPVVGEINRKEEEWFSIIKLKSEKCSYMKMKVVTV
jgi:hypothetical protein